jgi:transposase-like protein
MKFEYSSRWAAVSSIAAKIGCSAHTLHEWVKKAEVDSGKRAGLPSDVAEKMKALERENRELRQANEILRKASAYFAQAELEPPTEAMISFIDEHRSVLGVEPICRLLPIAPSTHYEVVAKRADVGRLFGPRTE